MARLELILLGGFQARLAPGGVIDLPTRKAQALLACLALPAGRSHPRDKLAAMLWGDVSESQARASLRKALFWLRQALADTRAMIADSETVTLKASAVSIDVDEFEHRAKSGSVAALAEAADLYQGDLLAGLAVEEPQFEEWLVGERERLREVHIEALARLLGHQRQVGAVESGILTALKLLAVDPLQEAVHRTLMRLYAQAGRRGAALRQYQACVTVLERELRTQPEDATRALYREILQSPGAAPPARREPVATGQSAMPHPASLGVGPPPPPAEAPLIGRQRELSRMTALLEDAWAGGRRLAAIVGEAGVGKSRLAAALGTLVVERGGRVLLGRCYESEQSLPFSAWIDALRGARLPANGDVIESLNPIWREELARLLPELGGGAVPPAHPTDALRLFEAVAQCLDALAARAPVLAVLEDLHWADELSVRLAGFLARRARSGPMLILGTTREDAVDPGGPQRAVSDALIREGALDSVHLSRLTRDETITLTRQLAGPSQTSTLTSLEEEIWRVSEGNPFMVVETMRAMRERGGAPVGGEGLVPARVRAFIAERLRGLSDRGRHLVDVAAVIGRRFEFALLQRASGLGDEEAADGVEELVRRRILDQVGGGFEFTHDQIREVRHAELVAPLRAAPSPRRQRDGVDAARRHRASRAGARHALPGGGRLGRGRDALAPGRPGRRLAVCGSGGRGLFRRGADRPGSPSGKPAGPGRALRAGART